MQTMPPSCLHALLRGKETHFLLHAMSRLKRKSPFTCAFVQERVWKWLWGCLRSAFLSGLAVTPWWEERLTPGEKELGLKWARRARGPAPSRASCYLRSKVALVLTAKNRTEEIHLNLSKSNLDQASEKFSWFKEKWDMKVDYWWKLYFPTRCKSLAMHKPWSGPKR